MENITSCTEYLLNVNKTIVSNNMKLFCTAIDIALDKYNSNGFVILDNNFKIPQHALIYTFAKSVLDKNNESIDNYKIILRASVKKGKTYFDSCTGYGEYHEIHKDDCINVETICDFHMYINFNNCDDILTIATDLNKTIQDDEPNIDEIYIYRPQAFSSFMTYHIGTYYFNEELNGMNNILNNGLFRVSLEFVNKNNDFHCGCNYPNLSDIFENEEELYKVYDFIYPFSSNKDQFVTDMKNTSINDIRCVPCKITETVISISDNLYIKEILDKYGYTFEKLYKSMFPGEYCRENFTIEHYPSIYDEDSTTKESDINVKSLDYKCIGLNTVPSETKNIMIEINDYMKIHNINYIKIIM